MTRSALTLSFSTHDQVENDVKDTVYQTAGIAYPVIPAPDQVENDVKDTVYQTAGITYPVIPDTSGIAFFKDGIPNQVGNDIFVIFIVILTHIIRY